MGRWNGVKERGIRREAVKVGGGGGGDERYNYTYSSNYAVHVLCSL